MTEQEIIQVLAGLPGVAVVTASEANGAPQVAWGDSFFFYDPDDMPDDRRFPFATIVIQDYHGFDEFSQMDRPGIFRLNVAVGRSRFEQLLGYSPAAHPEHHDGTDYTVLDRVLPHPTYATQGWVSILNPGQATGELARGLLVEAHGRAAERHRPRG